MKLRMIGLAAVVVLAALVPVGASAGPAVGPGPMTGPQSTREHGALIAGEAVGGAGTSRVSALPAFGTPTEAAADGSAATGREPGGEGFGRTAAHAERTTSHCGPELASPEGVEAQTCVLSREDRTWARTYYRNATGEELTAALTLMAPGGRTLQTNCEVEAGDEPRTCETPREPSRGNASGYWAVAEFAADHGTGEEPLLLRSGSNSQEHGGR